MQRAAHAMASPSTSFSCLFVFAFFFFLAFAKRTLFYSFFFWKAEQAWPAVVSAACPMASRYSRYTTQLRFLISWKVAREEPANRTSNMSFLGLQEIIRVNDCPKKKKKEAVKAVPI